MYRVDGGVSGTRKVEPVVKKPEVKPNLVRSNNDPTTNAAVYASRNDNNQQANLTRFRLNALVSPTVSQTAPTITEDEARQRADEIIAANGGKDNLDTEGVGRDLAEIARQNPADAWAIAHEMLGDEIDQNDGGKIKEDDKDEIAQTFTENLSDTEIAGLARDENGRAMLDRMQHHLLSGNVHGDEVDTANRIQTELGQYRTFSDWYQGIDPQSGLAWETPYGAAFDPNSSPEEAAAALESPTRPSNDIQSDVQAFTGQLEAHRDDPQWIQRYYAALGSEKTAELISNAATTSGYSSYLGGMGSGSEEAAELYNRNMEIIGDSLETLRANGGLSQTDMNNLVGAMEEGNFNPSVALDVFGKASTEVQELFVRAAIANGNDTVEAAGSYVLSQMSGSKQAEILGGLDQTQLNNFIQGAMAGQTDAINMSNFLATGIADQTTPLGGVEKLLENAVGQTFQYYPYSYQPFSNELQQNLFNAASQGLTNSDAFNNFKENTAFEDSLSSLFIRHRDALLMEAQKGPNGEDSGVINDSFERGLEKFFQLSLLTPPNGEQYENLSGSVFQFINDGVTALSDPALANRDQAAFNNFVNRFGMEPTDYAQVLGGVLGSVMDATGFAQESINADNAQREATIKFFTGLAFAMIPSVGGQVASGIGNQVFQHFVEKGTDYFLSQGQTSIETKINDLISGEFEGADSDRAREINTLILGIFDEGLRSLPNGSSLGGSSTQDQFDFQDYFQRGFDNTSQFTRFDDAIND